MPRYTKREIQSMVKKAYEKEKELKGVQVVFNIYTDGIYILDTEEDNIINVLESEQEAKETCEGINSGEFSDDGEKGKCYYKPILIDKYSGKRITRKNEHLYTKK